MARARATKPPAGRPRRAAASRPPPDGDTAARIFAAAEALFGEKGYDGVSVSDIAARARVNKALVFYHFESKPELFDRVIDRYYEAHQRALAAAFAAPGTFRERMRRVLDAYLEFMEKNGRYPRLVQHEIARGGRTVAKIHKNLAALFEWTVAALAEVAPAGGPLAAKQFFLTFSGMVVNYYTYGPVLEKLWGEDPMSGHALEERREHVRWVMDALLEKLIAEKGAAEERVSG
jgi:AcrR family transcriptional regulator